MYFFLFFLIHGTSRYYLANLFQLLSNRTRDVVVLSWCGHDQWFTDIMRGVMGVSKANFSWGIQRTHQFERKRTRTCWNDVIFVNLCRILHKLINLCRILHKLTKMTSFQHVLVLFLSNWCVRWIPHEKLALETPITPLMMSVNHWSWPHQDKTTTSRVLLERSWKRLAR